MFGKIGKLGETLGKLGEIKQKIEETKLALDAQTFAATGAGGDIKLTMNGNRKLISIEIAAALQHGDKTELEKQLLETFNKAVAEADKITMDEMKKAAGGIIPPGLI